MLESSLLALEIRMRLEAASTEVSEEAKEEIAQLKLKITHAKEEAVKDKIRWSTTYNLPLSRFTVNNIDFDLAAGEDVNQSWIPTWYREMILSARSQNSASGSSSSTTITSIPAKEDQDLRWTTADLSNASVWKGPNVWAGVDQNSMDFNSALVAGNIADSSAITTHHPYVASRVHGKA